MAKKRREIPKEKWFVIPTETDKDDPNYGMIVPGKATEEQCEAFAAYKKLYRKTQAKREAFENLMSAKVPAGKMMVFNYNFGKVSIAIVEDDGTSSRSTTTKTASGSLDELFAREGLQASSDNSSADNDDDDDDDGEEEQQNRRTPTGTPIVEKRPGNSKAR